MSAAVLPPPVSVDREQRKRFTRAEYEWMVDSEVFAGQRFELIDGELIDKMGQNQSHSKAIRLLLKFLLKLFDVDLILIQTPIEVSDRDRTSNFPEPDLSVIVGEQPDVEKRHPRGDELVLAVEIEESSILRDTTKKRDLYARAGVPEYWVFDLNGRRVIVHRALASGVYSEVLTLSEAESVELNGHSVAVARLLP